MPFIDIRGLPELQRKLDRLNQAVQKSIVKDALKSETNEVVLPAIKQLIPVRTGAFRDALKVRSSSGRGKLRCVVNDDVKRGDQSYGSFQELGDKNQEAQPSFRPAINENEERINNDLASKMGKGIEEAAK